MSEFTGEGHKIYSEKRKNGQRIQLLMEDVILEALAWLKHGCLETASGLQ